MVPRDRRGTCRPCPAVTWRTARGARPAAWGHAAGRVGRGRQRRARPAAQGGAGAAARIPLVSTNPAGAIYGTITVGALLAAESARSEGFGDTIAAVALTMVLYWIAHAYATSAADRIRDETHLTVKGFADALVHQVPILGGAVVPLLALVIFGIAGATLSTAVTAAIWTAAAVIAAIETTAAMRAGAKGGELAVQIGVGVGLGLLVIAIKVVLH
jgi:hypothetical protein